VTIASKYMIRKNQVLIISWVFSGFLLVSSASWVAFSIHRTQKNKLADLAPQNLSPLASRTALIYNVGDIVNANLFGDPTPPQKQTTTIPKTTLKLKAVGIFWSTDATKARAIIESGSSPAKLYATGADIKGSGATISEILKDVIILNRNGAKEKLLLNMPIVDAATNSESNLGAASAKSSHSLSSQKLGFPSQSVSPERLAAEFRASREAIRKARSKALSKSSAAESQ